MSGYPPPVGFNNPGYPGAPGSAYGAQGFPQQDQSQPSSGYGAPPAAGFMAPPAVGYGAQPGSGYGPPQTGGYGAPSTGGYGTPPISGYGAPPAAGYGQPSAGGYGIPQSGSCGAPPTGGYGAPPSVGYGAPVAGAYGGPQPGSCGAPPTGGYGASPMGGYGAPVAGAYGAPAVGGYGAAVVGGYGSPIAGGYGTPPTTGYGVPSEGGYAAVTGRPTLRPVSNFNAAQDAEDLRKAMRGLGTDEKKIISVLSKRSSTQRKQIAEKFKASFGKSLEKELKKELTGDFEYVVLASLMDIAHLQAMACSDAMKGAGTKEDTLIQILVSSTNAELQALKKAYSELYGRNLEKDICGDTSGDFERILVALSQGSREEGKPVDINQVAADADALYASGEGRVGTEEAKFTCILSQRSFQNIKELSNIYLKKHGKPLVKAIEKETSGYYEKTLVSIVRLAENRYELIAEWFHDAMVGAGTRDKDLVRLTLKHAEVDLRDIDAAYTRIYKKTLAKAIGSDTSGDYKRFLLSVVEGN